MAGKEKDSVYIRPLRESVNPDTEKGMASVNPEKRSVNPDRMEAPQNPPPPPKPDK